MNDPKHASRKARAAFFFGWCLCVVLSLAPVAGAVGHFGATIKTAELALQGDHYVLSGDWVFQLSDPAKEALQSGVPLYWDIRIHVLRNRPFLWDKTIVERVVRYRIQYHALLNMYRVRNENSGMADNFSTLSAALDLISTLRDFRVIEKSALDPKNSYYAGVKIVFDREALPLPLRPVAYLNSQWYLSSGWYLWPLRN